jgi:hypothetical protein
MNTTFGRRAAIASVTALALLGVATSARAAGMHPAKRPPKPPQTLTALYPASGSTLIAKPNSTVALGPTTLTTVLNLNAGTFTGSLPLPPTTASFSVLGLLPVTATVTFIAAGPLTGTLTTDAPGVDLASSASYTVQLSNVSIAGFPAEVGNSCETSSPVAIAAGATKFNVLAGGT